MIAMKNRKVISITTLICAARRGARCRRKDAMISPTTKAARRRDVVQRLCPLCCRDMNPQEHQIGGLGVAMCRRPYSPRPARPRPRRATLRRGPWPFRRYFPSTRLTRFAKESKLKQACRREMVLPRVKTWSGSTCHDLSTRLSTRFEAEAFSTQALPPAA